MLIVNSVGWSASRGFNWRGIKSELPIKITFKQFLKKVRHLRDLKELLKEGKKNRVEESFQLYPLLELLMRQSL